MKEKAHILEILRKVKNALKEKNYVKIKYLSNELIHQSSIEQDIDIITVAVIIYALSKLIERPSYKKQKNWDNFYKRFLRNLEDMIKALEKDNEARFREEIISNRRLIEELTGNLKYYITDVFRRAKINKASRIYEHGISMEKTAKTLGVSLWELAEYAGRTRIGDVNLNITMPVRQRVKIAEDIFKWNI